MKLHKSIAITIGLVVGLSSCDSFLSHDPDDRTKITKPSEAAELAVSAYSDYSTVPLFEFRSDNVMDKGKIRNLSRQWSAEMYKYNEYVSNTTQDSPEGVWREYYKAIGHANQALLDLSKMDQDDSSVKEARGEALMCRSYALYMLAQIFTAPYDPATAESQLGLPCPTLPETHLLQDYERGTLKELYDVIVKDFEEGYSLVGDNYKSPKFHFTRQASAAFGTRLYRTLGNWDRVIELSNDCLGTNPALYTRKINDKNSKYQGTYAEREQIWSYETEDCNFLLSVAFSYWTRVFAGEKYGLTTQLMHYFSKKTKNGKYVGENFLGVAPHIGFFGNASVVNIPKFFEHFEYTNVTQGTGFVHGQFVLLGGDEVLFNMAEAYVMKNQFERARDLLQLFVSNYMRDYDPSSDEYKVTEEKILTYYKDVLGNQVHPDRIHGIDIKDFNPFFETTTTQEAYLRACVDLKRMAFLQEGMRWMDNRQYRMDVVHNVVSDDGSSESYLVLRGDDPRYAVQIPENTRAYLEPNPGYENELKPITK